MNQRHFKDKEAVGHVAEMQAKGILDSAEVHATEMPGHLSAATDAAKESALVIAFVWALLATLQLPLSAVGKVLAVFGLGWLVWKTGRSAWLGWSRLERLHRVVAQEKWEIDHHRGQEREELKELYHAKGFEGQLLEDVIDVLMADGDRLLRVMVEEELGLSLESQEHPLKQGLGALAGALAAMMVCGAALFLYPPWGLFIGALVTVGSAAGISSRYEENRTIPAIVWNLGIATLSFSTVYFLIQYL